MTKQALKQTTLALFIGSLAALGGCNSSSSTPEIDDSNSTPALTGQAVDGFIVGGKVYCDGVESGITQAGGAYSCPEGTRIARVRGGIDVGYDAQETTDGLPFTGELVGPADGKFVTPLSSLVVRLASTDGSFDPSKLQDAVEKIANALGVDSLDLSADPEKNLDIAKLNAQISLVVSAFASSPDDYAKVMDSFAELLDEYAGSGKAIKLSGEDKTSFSAALTSLNSRLARNYSVLGVDSGDLNDLIDNLVIHNRNIEQQEHPGEIRQVTNIPLSEYAFGIIKANPGIRILDASDNSYTYDMYNYITPDTIDGKHQILLNNGIRRIEFQPDVITVQNTKTNAPVDVGIRIESESDNREIRLIGRGLSASMVAGDSTSLSITVPDEIVWNAYARKSDGTEVFTELKKSGDRVFKASNGGININFDAIADRLGKVDANFDKSDYLNLTRETGNFKITLVIDGLKIAKLIGDAPNRIVYSAWGYHVDIGNDKLYAPGWEGYFTVQ